MVAIEASQIRITNSYDHCTESRRTLVLAIRHEVQSLTRMARTKKESNSNLPDVCRLTWKRYYPSPRAWRACPDPREKCNFRPQGHDGLHDIHVPMHTRQQPHHKCEEKFKDQYWPNPAYWVLFVATDPEGMDNQRCTAIRDLIVEPVTKKSRQDANFLNTHMEAKHVHTDSYRLKNRHFRIGLGTGTSFRYTGTTRTPGGFCDVEVRSNSTMPQVGAWCHWTYPRMLVCTAKGTQSSPLKDVDDYHTYVSLENNKQQQDMPEYIPTYQDEYVRWSGVGDDYIFCDGPCN